MASNTEKTTKSFDVDDTLVQAAIELAKKSFPDGMLAGASAMYTESGKILTSTYPYGDGVNQRLCYETGAICEAHKLKEKIVACCCVVRRTGKKDFVFFAPCGVCQERLFYWGGSLKVAVPDSQDPTKWISKTLDEVQPYYWAEVLKRS